jgi:hypothetical protein
MKKRKAMSLEAESTLLPSQQLDKELHQFPSDELPADRPALENGAIATEDTESTRLLGAQSNIGASTESEASPVRSPKSPNAKFQRSVSWPDWSLENPGKLARSLLIVLSLTVRFC